MTSVEADLVSFFAVCGVKLTSIPTEPKSKKRTPDFIVEFPEMEAVLELKEIEKNTDEAFQVSLAERGENASIDHSYDVSRFVAKIRDANSQLKQKSSGRPGITVIADTRSFLAKALSPQQILAEAMFGRETVWIPMPYPAVPNSRGAIAHDFGWGRSLGPETNTTTSAVALFIEVTDGSHVLLVHHNPNATTPLPRGLIRDPAVREFVIPSIRKFSGFEEVTLK